MIWPHDYICGMSGLTFARLNRILPTGACARLSLLLLGFYSLFLHGCSGETDPPADLGYEYFTLQSGRVTVYSVDSIFINDKTGASDTTRYFFKEDIREEIPDSSGTRTFRAFSFVSGDTAKGWRWRDFYFYRVGANEVQKITGNTSRLIFVYPVVKNKKWNVNTYNAAEPEFGRFSMVKEPWNNEQDCAEVTLRESIDFLSERIEKSVYSRNKGPVYHSETHLELDQVKGGTIIRMRRI